MSNQQIQRGGPFTFATMGAFLAGYEGALQQLAGKVIDVKRLIRQAWMAARINPKILTCTPHSLLNSVCLAAELGLEIATPLQHGWLVPYGNECTYIVGYRGYGELFRRNGGEIRAGVIYEKDEREIIRGTEETLVIRPFYGGDAGPPILYYATAEDDRGRKRFDIMTVAQVEGIRQRSKAKENGPWVTDFDEMAKKTVVRRIAKLLPLSPALGAAMEAEDRAESGEKKSYSEMLDDKVIDGPADTPAPSGGLKEELREKAAAARAQETKS